MYGSFERLFVLLRQKWMRTLQIDMQCKVEAHQPLLIWAHSRRQPAAQRKGWWVEPMPSSPTDSELREIGCQLHPNHGIWEISFHPVVLVFKVFKACFAWHFWANWENTNPQSSSLDPLSTNLSISALVPLITLSPLASPLQGILHLTTQLPINNVDDTF